MAEDKIPSVDAHLSASRRESPQEELELRLLDLEQENLSLKDAEFGQRYWIRWIAVCVGLIVILGMTAVLWHLTHMVFWGPFVFVSPAFTVAMIVAPIASITAITVALFVGAFRRFDDKDLETVSANAVGAYRVLKH